MRLVGFALSEKMTVFAEHNAAYIALTREELKRYDYNVGDTEGLVNYPLSIKGIVFTALLTENKDFIKVSLRSKGSFPANKICEEYFNGGGHMNAAGGKFFGTMHEAENLFPIIIEKYQRELNL